MFIYIYIYRSSDVGSDRNADHVEPKIVEKIKFTDQLTIVGFDNLLSQIRGLSANWWHYR